MNNLQIIGNTLKFVAHNGQSAQHEMCLLPLQMAVLFHVHGKKYSLKNA